jgi:eukaryotic-like serine/threonine-protein kinase
MSDLITRKLEGESRESPRRGKSGRLQPGTLLQGRYRIVDTLGSGGFSSVYQARDMHFPAVTRLCAVKEMVHVDRDPEVRALATGSFEREASILATLSHSAVPDVYDFFTEDDRGYLVLEYIGGKNLEDLMAESDASFPTGTVIDWALQLTDVLGYLHSHRPQPVVFRDLKPSNIMLDQHGRIRLIDFNIAKAFQSGVKGTMIGTEGYSPPEQYRGEASPAGDVYAMGATLHHLLTRRDPRQEAPFSFPERPIRVTNPDVPASLEAIVDRCLAYNASNRYQNALEVREALLAMVGDASLPGRIEGLKQRAGPGVPAMGSLDGAGVRPLWTFRCEDEIRAAPLVSGGVVYVGAYDNNLYALDAERGDFLWKFATSGSIASTPAIHEDDILIGSADHNLYCLSRSTGRVRWQFEAGGPIYSSPRADFGHVFFGCDDGHLYALSVSNGRRVWQAPAIHGVRSTPLLHKERIFFGTEGGYLFCVDLSGKVKWQYETRRPIITAPAVAEDMVVFGSMDGTVYATDLNSGWAIWQYRTRKPVASSPVIDGETVYVGSSDGKLYALNLFSGRKVWEFESEGQVNSSPAVWEEAVYFGATNGWFYCLDAKRGRQRWRFETNGVVVGSPVITNGIVYFGSCDHHLYALPA